MNLKSIFSHIFLLNIFFFLIDKMICKPMISYISPKIKKDKKNYQRTRWYILHIFINILTAITSFNGVYYSYKNKYTSLSAIEMAKPYSLEWFYGPTSPLPILFIGSGHLYHILFFSTTASDVYHHLLFAMTMCTLNMIGNYGFARNIIPFVLSGLPGIIEYIIMTLYKFEYLSKKITRYLVTIMHCLLRFPLSMIITYYLSHQILFNPNVLNPIYTSIVIFLLFLNATQYCYENIKASIKYYKLKY